MKKILFAVTLLALCTSCDFFTKKSTNEKKIAEVNGKVLYQSDVAAIFPAGISAEDSLMLLRNYVNNWARRQLVVELANQYLSKEQKDVGKELEDYKLSLLIYRYEKMYLEQQLDTLVSNENIAKFYNEAPQNFIVNKPIAKVMVIKVPEDTVKNKRLRMMYRSKHAEDHEELMKFCNENAGACTNFDEQWIGPETLAEKLPMDARQIENDWSKGYIYLVADGSEYFVSIYELVKAGEQAPLDYERNTITSIIRNKRKQDVLKNLENNIFNDALNRNHLKIYIDN